VARYYRLEYDAERNRLSWQEDLDKKTIAEKLDGGYVLKTDRQDLTGDEIWRTYMLLTRVEAAFRAMNGPLLERPIFHHLQARTQTHIFLCVLAPSAGGDREAIPGPRPPYLVVDPAPATQHAPGRHRSSADRGREDLKDPQSHHPGVGTQGNLRHAQDSDGGYETG
jgi:hypothetical protein